MQSYEAKCDDCAHCVDLSTPQDNDPQVLKDIRTQILNSFEQWINDHWQKIEFN